MAGVALEIKIAPKWQNWGVILEDDRTQVDIVAMVSTGNL